MKRTTIALSALTIAMTGLSGLTGCQSSQPAEMAVFPSANIVVPNERIYLADFGPMPSVDQSSFYLGAGDSLGAACFARYIASLGPANQIGQPMRYVTVPAAGDRPE